MLYMQSFMLRSFKNTIAALLTMQLVLCSGARGGAAAGPGSRKSKDPPITRLESAALWILSGGDPTILSKEIRRKLCKRTGLSINHLSRNAKPLKMFLDNSPKTSVFAENFVALGKSLGKPPYDAVGDLMDMHRSWGMNPLPLNDAVFEEPTYLQAIIELSGQVTSPSIEKDFHNAWRMLAPKNTVPMVYAQTGSDANALLYNLAQLVVSKKKMRGRLSEPAGLLFFDGIFGGGRGPWVSANHLDLSEEYGVRNMDKFRIPGPYVPDFHPTEREIQKAKAKEREAIGFIKKAVDSDDPPIGAILMEPVLGSNKAQVFRPTFLVKLRKLADELGVPIVADEILTGGGRTGQFFGYQLYGSAQQPKFEPDFVTFGKALQIAGIAKVARSKSSLADMPNSTLTLAYDPLAMLRSIQVIKRIAQGDLIANSERVGAYFLQKLRKYLRQQGVSTLPAREAVRGQGLLIYAPNVLVTGDTDIGRPGVRHAMGRVMPYLTISKEEVDRVIESDRKIREEWKY